MSENQLKDKGLIVVNTGDGKGKTTAAFGVIFRALGRGMKCAVVQYIKGKWKTGERTYAESIPGLSFHVMGRGFTWDSDDLDRDKKAAQEAWNQSKVYLSDEIHDVVVLDEITYAINYNFIKIDEVISALKSRRPMKHVILTGRNCPEEIVQIADLVTQMNQIKHPYTEGIRAQKGIDY